MSNDEYLQWQGLLYKVAKKYVGVNNLYDIDDLIQIGAIGLAKGLETYESESEIPIINYLANNIGWTIYREINKKKSIDNTISIYTPIGDEEEGNILEDILQDNNVDVEAFIEDRIMMQTYKDEIIRCLDPKKADVIILKFFENMPNNYIEKVLDITGISNHIRESRATLIRRSKLFMAEYRRIRNLDDYSNPAIALI